jgi:uncharacterized protein YjiS (DUF1127 family)
MEETSGIHFRRMQFHSGYSFFEVLAGLAAAGWRTLSRWGAARLRRRREARLREEFRGMSDHFLKDIGLTRGDIDRMFR